MGTELLTAAPPGNDKPFSELRQEQRLDAIPALYRQQHERLALELALGMDDETAVFKRHGYTQEQAITLLSQPAFIAALESTVEEVRTKGLTFRMKARAQAEELLTSSYEMATDPNCSASVRADLIQWTARMGDLEPPKNKDEGKTGGGLTLSITFAGQPPQQVVHEGLTFEQEG